MISGVPFLLSVSVYIIYSISLTSSHDKSLHLTPEQQEWRSATAAHGRLVEEHQLAELDAELTMFMLKEAQSKTLCSGHFSWAPCTYILFLCVKQHVTQCLVVCDQYNLNLNMNDSGSGHSDHQNSTHSPSILISSPLKNGIITNSIIKFHSIIKCVLCQIAVEEQSHWSC